MRHNNINTKACLPCLVFCLFFFGLSSDLFAQQDEDATQDSIQTGISLGRLTLNDPDSIISKYEYDPAIDRYVYTQSVGEFNVSHPVFLTPEQYDRLVQEETIKNYFKEKITAFDGRGEEESRKNLLPNFYVNSNFFESIFGSNTIEVIPQGSVAMDLGVRYQKNDNPSLSPRNRSNLTFDFDQRISLSLLANVGTRLKITANYDTEATFDFQNLIKLEYTPTEDDIIRKIEAGNVSMPINSSLISGAQSLFGFKTELQFGNTSITGVFAEQRSQNRRVTAQGGGTLEEFEIRSLDYDEDRHFFLAQYFRDQYDDALANYPFIASDVQILRLEVWTTNRSQRTDNVRNLVAVQDLGEVDPNKTRIFNEGFAPAGFFNFFDDRPRNEGNDYNPLAIGNAASSVLTEDIRTISTAKQGFGSLSASVNEGFDYAILENARKLEEGRDFNFDQRLGYISLNQRLSNDEVLGVAFQYSVGGDVYQVGEFANDGVDATDTSVGMGGQIINNQALVVKLLKSNITEVNDPIWDLMMKNIYSTGAFQLSQEDFRLNILYTDPSPVNYLIPIEESTFPNDLKEKILLDIFNFDRLNRFNDPQNGGDGFFDFLPGITIDQRTGRIIFTKVEPFGEFIHQQLGGGTYNDPNSYNPNQEQYVFRQMYVSTKVAALQDADNDKYILKGRFKSEGSTGIPLGAFNVPRGSVRVTAGGRILQEGIDYTVNYQAGTVQILDPSLENSNVPIEVSVENNAIFGQQSRRFMGFNIEHRITDNFIVGGTLLNLRERPLTQKSNFGFEPVNNTIFGLNANYSTEVPFLTRVANFLPNVETEAPSNLSLRGEWAYLQPNSPKNADFQGKTTAYLDDFEGAQVLIDIRSPLAWSLSSPPNEFTGAITTSDTQESGFQRSKLAWYTIDPVFYTGGADGISDSDVSLNTTRRVFINEIFPEQDVSRGQTTVQSTLDIAYYPDTKGPYNNNTEGDFNSLPSDDRWGGMMRSITSTDFEQANVEFIQFWVLDPYYQNGVTGGTGGELIFNLGNISEDILTDGLKQYENGLSLTPDVIDRATQWGQVPATQSLVYAFDSDASDRPLQDVGFDGLQDTEESTIYTNNSGDDAALDNYEFYLTRDGGVLNRYLNYNNPQGNSPVTVSNTNRGSTTLPDVEDVDRDLTMNTVDSYLEYRLPIEPNTTITDEFVNDIRTINVPTPDGNSYDVRWIQYKIPINDPSRGFIQGMFEDGDDIADINSLLRSTSFIRLYLTGFDEEVVLRFGTLDLVRGDWRSYTRSLDPNDTNVNDDTTITDVNTVNILENEQRQPIPYVLPPGVVREQLNNNNTIIRQNEQSLSFAVRDLEAKDSRAVFKSVNIDMRQYSSLEMFMHAEQLDLISVDNNELVGFLRLGTDFDENYYQVEVPLQITPANSTSADIIWPSENDLDVPLSIFSRIKSVSIANQTLNDVTFYNEEGVAVGEFDPRQANEYRVAIKGNPSLGNIRAIMVGIKNATNTPVSGEVWFNELRLSGLDNGGGWSAIAQMDANMADFATLSATGRMSTSGFGSLDQTPNERSREEVIQFDVVTNLNLGQLLPKKWGLQLPFNYSHSEELITPEFDPLYQDLKLDDRLDAATDAEAQNTIESQAEDYTKRQSYNLIGVRKNRGPEQKQRFYDIENFTFNFSYNQTKHRDFEIEEQRDQNVKTGLTYNYNFKPKKIEPFKKSDSLFTGKYWQWLKDLNFNWLPSSISVNSNINRDLSRQRFRSVFVDGVNNNTLIDAPELKQLNFLFDWQYNIAYNLTESLRLNFTASNYNIVKNYLEDDGTGQLRIREDFGIWNGFWNTGDPNRHTQQLQLNYKLPFDKILPLNFISADYSYTGDFDWQRGSDVLIDIAGEQINTIQNANTHSLNVDLDFDKFYRNVGLVKRTGRQRASRRRNNTENGEKPQKTSKGFNTLVDLLTPLKRINASYSENNGKVLPGYTESIGFIGTLKPSVGFIFGSQSDVRFEAARKGWLTNFENLNQQYMERHSSLFNATASILPFKDLTIDLQVDRQYAENYSENFEIADSNGDGIPEYNNLLSNEFGDFSISSSMILTSFKTSDENSSETFDEFKENRLVIAKRLAARNGDDPGLPGEYPDGYGPTNQSVVLPAFLAAYTGAKVDKISLRAFRDVPIPGWNLKFSGLMRIKWFKKQFKRFTLTHGYRSSYSINSFRTNLEFDPNLSGINKLRDQGGDFLNSRLYGNVTLVEQFNPLLRLDFEMRNSVSILAEIKRDRGLSFSFDNDLLSEVQGKEYILGLGYRIKDVRLRTNIGGKKETLKGDINLKADLSLRDNITIIRNLAINSNQVTAGQKLWSLKFTADWALTRNLNTLFFYDHTFSEFAVSTAFPQTTIRSGFTLRYNFGN